MKTLKRGKKVTLYFSNIIHGSNWLIYSYKFLLKKGQDVYCLAGIYVIFTFMLINML